MKTRLISVLVLAVFLVGAPVARAGSLDTSSSVVAEVLENLQANYLQPLDAERLLCNGVLALREHLPTLGIFFLRDRQAVRLAFDTEELTVDFDDLNKPRKLTAALEQILEFVGDEDEPDAGRAQRFSVVDGVLRGLGDPHTVFLSPAVYDKLSRTGDTGFADIGLSVKRYGDKLIASAVRRGSPACLAGIRPGEIIVAVNGRATQGLGKMEVVAALWGRTGTPVALRLGDAMGNERGVLVVRRYQALDEVRVTRMRGDIVAIRLATFTSGVAQRLGQLLTAEGERGRIRGLILDLRENPGGFLSEGVELLELFLPPGVMLVRVSGADQARDEVHRTGPRAGRFRGPPMILLVDGQSASVTELCARALQAHHRALLLGERTYGKGTVQSLFELADGSALKMTVARYLGPKGRPLEHGIDPDVPVGEAASGDRPLKLALEVLRKATSARLPALRNLARSLAHK